MLYGPENLNVFWEDFGQIGSGDPIVLWDPGAERWILTELGNSSTNTLLIAISTTSDPFGAWHAYEFEASGIPSYPKYGIWPNAYVVTTREEGSEIQYML